MAGLLGLGAAALLVQAACANDTAPETVTTAQSAIDQAECQEYGGSWSNGGCTLPGGTNEVTVTADEDEPFVVWTGPLPGEETDSIPPSDPPPTVEDLPTSCG